MTSVLSELNREKSSRTNFCVDYVINYSFKNMKKNEAEAQFVRLIEALRDVGLATEVRHGDKSSLFVFVRVASQRKLEADLYRLRLQDWLYDARNIAPPQEMHKNFEEKPITEAERLRFVYSLITSPKTEGGVGITPKSGEWKCIESIFPLHDHEFNKLWVKNLSSKYFLDEESLAEIKNHFGERIAFYFAFLQSYFLFLTFPAGLGFFSWVFLGQYSPVYAIFNGLWCVVFVEYWKKQQKRLSDQWVVNGAFKFRHQRSEFQHEYTLNDPVTGETVQIYSPLKRLLRQLLQIPFAIAASIALGSLIATCFAIEIFISEIYDGPFKTYLVLLPTIILTSVMPTISAILTGFASKLTDLENYKTVDSHENSMIQKVFVLNFITSYLPIFLTAFVYVPFAQVLVPYLNFFDTFIKVFMKKDENIIPQTNEFQINPDRLTKQVVYFTVTAQIVDFGLEVIVPYAKRKISSKVKKLKANRAAKRNEGDIPIVDDPNESEFLARVRTEADMSKYDVTSDLREMVVQFGYLSLFSVIWSLTALSFLINNWIEIRGDALKISMETQRPVPWQADSIGPWVDALGFLAWLGSLTSATLVYLFSGDGLGPDGTPWNITGWGLLLTLFLSEHIFMITQIVVRKIINRIDDSERLDEKSERLKIRKIYLQEKLKQQVVEKVSDQETGDKICVDGYIIDNFTKGDVPSDYVTVKKHNFWLRHLDVEETISIGTSYISKISSYESKKEL